MYKQIIIARKDLNLSPGKLAAQVAHGSMAFLLSLITDSDYVMAIKNWGLTEWGAPKTSDSGEVVGYDFEYVFDKDLYEQWFNGEYTKCVLQAKNKSQLLKAKSMAEESGLVEYKDFWLVYDNCHTELEPEENGKTLTCIGFKPMDSEVADRIGRKFHLYV